MNEQDLERLLLDAMRIQNSANLRMERLTQLARMVWTSCSDQEIEDIRLRMNNEVDVYCDLLLEFSRKIKQFEP